MLTKPEFFFRHRVPLALSVVCLLLAAARPGVAANFYQGVSPSTLPWPGGIVPYQFDTNVTAAQQAVYLDGMREWELAANAHFIPRSNQTQYVILRFDYQLGTNTYVASVPPVLTVDTLSRGQVGHETGHLLGLQHEHVRTDRDSFLNVNFANLMPAQTDLYLIDSNSTPNGAYDFESVMHYGRTLFSIDPDHLDVLTPKPPSFLKYYYRIGNLALSIGDRAAAAFLYGPPATPLTNLVTTTADRGFGSLRAAIYFANDHPGTTVRFNIPTNDPGYSNGVFTIFLSGELPPLVTDGTVIDGATQPGFAGTPVVALSGAQLIREIARTNFFFSSGLHLFASNCVVRGLAFNSFPDAGIVLQFAFAQSNHVEGCFVGLDPHGTNAAGNREGVWVMLDASHNVIGGTNASQRNVISGNQDFGVILTDTNSTLNSVVGNFVGLDAGGSNAVMNANAGVGIFGGASSNRVGGPVAGSGNVISGNAGYGIFVGDPNTAGTIIQGNYLGLDASGNVSISNPFGGIGVFNGAHHVTIGGTNAAARNVASGNSYAGLYLGVGTVGDVVQGNYFGLNGAGTAAVSNGVSGIFVVQGATGNLVGGTTPGTANVISGNFSYGIFIGDPGTTNNLVQGNFIGTGPQGTNAFANGFSGVGVFNGATGNAIGGTTAGAGNVISGNGSEGVTLGDPGTTGNVVQGNRIGTKADGLSALPNIGDGVFIINRATNNLIGGTTAAARNLISGNGRMGVFLVDPNTSGNIVQGNFIGTDASGNAAISNGTEGVSFFNGASGNQLGGTAAGAGNVIAASVNRGIFIADPGTSGNVIQGNKIGIGADGVTAMGNGFEAIAIVNGASSNLIGGASVAARNVIGASARGVWLSDTNTSGNLVQGNYLGVAADGVTARSNRLEGVILLNGASGNVIGLDVNGAGAGNVIAYSALSGVGVYDPGTTGNTIRGNAIFNNAGLGINLAGGTEDVFGVTANDAADADSGPNGLQNFPRITTALASGGATIIGGVFTGAANRNLRVDVYRNAVADPSGHGEGQVYVGSADLNTDAGGNGYFTLGASGALSGQWFAVTTTDATTGDTSEFSVSVSATNGPSPIAFAAPFVENSTGFSFRVAVQTNLSYRIQASTNLAAAGAWTDVTNFVATASLMQLTDRSATNFAKRFYRAVVP